MTRQERDFEEILSRVLHTTTDQIEPVGDGLTKIRARLTEPWLKRQFWLLRSELVALRWLVVVRCELFLATVRASSAATADAAGGSLAGTAERTADHSGRLRWLRPVLGPVTASAAAKRLGKASAPLRRSVGPAMAWLRPALAVAGAVVLVVAGVFALGQMRGAFIGLENATGTGTQNSGNGGGSGNTNGGGSQVTGPNAGTTARGRSGKHGSTSRNKTTPSPAACSSPSTPPVNSPSPTPDSSPTSASPTPTETPTPTQSPTPTDSPTPTASAGPMASPMIAGTHKWSIRTTVLVVCAPAPQASPTNQATSGG